MKSQYRTILAAVLVTATTTTQAALVALGDFTTDTDTGLDWLDLDLSLGLSANQVSAQLGTGGLFEGYQIATFSQVKTYLANAGWIGPFDPANDLNIGFVATFKSLTTSLTNDPAGDLGALSFVDDPLDDLGMDRFLDDWAGDLGDLGVTHYIYTTPIDPNVGQQGVGTFLVRASAVPLPGAVWLFGSGLVFLIGSARRRFV